MLSNLHRILPTNRNQDRRTIIPRLSFMGEVKLLGWWPSPYSRRVELALKLKGVEYEYIEQDLANKSPLLLQYNPVHKKIPVLIHNGNPIVESHLILEYIDETWTQNPFLPQDPHDRAVARFWAKFIDEKCATSVRNIAWPQDGDKEKAIEETYQNLKTLENELKGKKFFGGDKIGFVDIVANTVAYWTGVILDVNGLELLTPEKFPDLCNWIDEYLSSPVVQETLPPRDKLHAVCKARFSAPTWHY